MYCIYHNRDLDGFASAAIVKMKYPDVILVGYDRGDMTRRTIPDGEEVVMVDISYSMKDMHSLAKASGGKLTWIDHHISDIKSYEEYVSANGNFMDVLLKDGVAACELTWKYFFPGKEMPLAIELLGMYDTWRNHDKIYWETVVLPFQFGMRSICNSPETFPVSLLTVFEKELPFDRVSDIVFSGLDILKYINKQNELTCRISSFEVEFEGLRAICLNATAVHSDLFKSVYDELRHDLMIGFSYNGSMWKFSLRTTKDSVDCSELAKIWGGGGHRKAAGFETNRLEHIFINGEIA